MKNILTVDSLVYKYPGGRHNVEALKGISFAVKPGEIFGFIGPNGAGKTTTIKLILGLMPITSGNISIMGLSPARTVSRKRLGYMPETSNLSPYLSPRELLNFYASFFDMSKKSSTDRIEYLLDLVGLSDRADHLMKNFSKGMMQKVSFAQALVNDPDLLVLDEPTGGLDPLARANMRKILTGLRAEGKTVFFSSHELSEVELITDRILMISEGSVLAKGSTEKLISEKGEHRSLERFFLDLMESSA